jgi:hypothetical protein
MTGESPWSVVSLESIRNVLTGTCLEMWMTVVGRKWEEKPIITMTG